jgi:RND family efflux transporter MFP subunit
LGEATLGVAALAGGAALLICGVLSASLLPKVEPDGTAAAASTTNTATMSREPQPIATDISRVELGAISPSLIESFAGHRSVSRPAQDAIMGFPQPTMIREVASNAGATVKRGQLLVRGDDAEDAAVLQLQEVRVREPLAVQRAKAAMDLAAVEYQRLKDAEAKGASGPQEVERARLSAEVARIDHLTAQNNQEQEELQVVRLRARLERLRLSAPFDGVVDQVMVDAGQSVSEQDKIVRVVQIDPLRIDVNTPTSDPASETVRQGDEAWVLCDLGGKAVLVRGVVVEVAPTVEAASRTRRVRVEVKNPAGPQQMLSGQPVWVRYSPVPEGLKLAENK